MIILDTQAAIWPAVEEGLGKRSQSLAGLAQGCLAVSALSFCEMATLISSRRLKASGSAAEQLAEFLYRHPRASSYGDIAISSLSLPVWKATPQPRHRRLLSRMTLLMTLETVEGCDGGID